MSTDAWDAAPDDRTLIAALGWDERGLARKRRLYLAALCRRFWADLPSPTGRAAVVAAEAFADGGLSLDELAAAHQAHLRAHSAVCMERGKRFARTRECLLSSCAWAASEPGGCRLVATSGRQVAPVAAALMRDVFGPPGRPAVVDPAWRTADVLGIARGIYAEGAFERMSLLADALLDAGCDDEAVVSHCKSAGPHVRGCWVVDLVLGRS